MSLFSMLLYPIGTDESVIKYLFPIIVFIIIFFVPIIPVDILLSISLPVLSVTKS